MFGREFEPGEKVEGLAEIARMVQAPRDGGQVLQANRRVLRGLFKDRAALVLREFPPAGGLLDWDQRRECRRRAAQAFLLRPVATSSLVA